MTTTDGVTVPQPGGNPEQVAEAQDRQRKAMELRMAGASYPDIAKVLKFHDTPHAFRAVAAAFDRPSDDGGMSVREEYRNLSIARCERLLRGCWSAAVSGTDSNATANALRIMEREARLLGLDAPTRIAVSDDQKQEMLSLLNDLEATLVPGEVVPDEPKALDASGDRPY